MKVSKSEYSLKTKVVIVFLLMTVIVLSVIYLFETLHTFLLTENLSFEIMALCYFIIISVAMLGIRFILGSPVEELSSDTKASDEPTVEKAPDSEIFENMGSKIMENISSRFISGVIQGFFKTKKL